MKIREEIEKLAYEIYEKSGKISGRDVQNWLAAEKIVMARHGKDFAASARQQFDQVIVPAAQKVKEAVAGTVTELKAAAAKGLKKTKPK